MPESADGACAYPVMCPCRGRVMVERLADLAERYQRALDIAADFLDASEEDILALVDLELDMRRNMTPERRAGREAA